MTTPTTSRVPEFTLGDRLRKARELAGFDQSEFARVADISRTTVINYEHGKRQPRPVYLRAWSIATGVDLRWLVTGHAAPTDTAAACLPGFGRAGRAA